MSVVQALSLGFFFVLCWFCSWLFRWVSRVLVPTAPFGVGVGVSLGGVFLTRRTQRAKDPKNTNHGIGGGCQLL